MYDSTEHNALASIMLFICFVEILFMIPMAYIQARVKSLLFIGFSLFKLILGISLNIYFVAVLKQGIAGIMTANIINGSIGALAVCAYTFGQVGFSINVRILRRMLKFALPLVPGSLFLFILNNGDRFFLQRFATEHLLGLYSLGYKLGTAILLLVLTPFNKVWSVYVFKIYKDQDYQSIYPKVFKFLTLAYTIIGLGISIYSYEIVRILADKSYIDAHVIVPLIIFAYLFWTASTFFDVAFYVKNKTIYKPFLIGFGAAVILVLYRVLIPEYYHFGAAEATLIGFFIYSIAVLVVSLKILPLKYNYFQFFIMLVIAVAFYFVGTIQIFESQTLTIVYKLVIYLCYPILVYNVGYFSKEDKETTRLAFIKLKNIVLRRDE
jgi:O-antigen/teichoic acid export membrane protein